MNGCTFRPTTIRPLNVPHDEPHPQRHAGPDRKRRQRVHRPHGAQHHGRGDARQSINRPDRQIDPARDDHQRRADRHDREEARVGRRLDQRVGVQEIVDLDARSRIDVRPRRDREDRAEEHDDEHETELRRRQRTTNHGGKNSRYRHLVYPRRILSYLSEQLWRQLREILPPERPDVADVGNLGLGELDALRLSQSLSDRLMPISPSDVPQAIQSILICEFAFSSSCGKCFANAAGSTGVAGAPRPPPPTPSHMTKAPLNDAIHANRSRWFSPTYTDSAPPIESPAIARSVRSFGRVVALLDLRMTSVSNAFVKFASAAARSASSGPARRSCRSRACSP